MTEATVDLVRYVFLDVVGFTHERSVEAQTEIIAKLNDIVSTKSREITSEKTIFIPTGDGICIGMVGKSAFDAHIKLALNILESIHNHNSATSNLMLKFEVRVGINENSDNIVLDINEGENIAGTGINMASRIMGLADASQILVSTTVYEALSTRAAYMGSFRQYKSKIKHGYKIRVYQYIMKDKPGLNISPPSIFQQPKQKHRLTEWEAYFLAWGIALKGIILYQGKKAPWSSYASIIFLYFLATDSVGIAHQTEIAPYKQKIFGRGDVLLDKVLEYYISLDYWVCAEFGSKIVGSLKHLSDLVEKEDNVFPRFEFPNQLAHDKIYEDQPQVAKEILQPVSQHI